MTGKKILVIDDSATIRRLVDSYLSPEGSQVLLAATAEDGLKLARHENPDLILLDHQLPGTTGFEVCQQLLGEPSTRQTPVVISSTLRKRAFVEYADLPNVVDMLPKPYSAELLKTTVANALETGALVVDSQNRGTAVPEVNEELAEPALAGTFREFRLREVLDFLTNAAKRGILEVEAERRRTVFYLDRGRVMGVTASGIDPEYIIERLPSSLQNLAPVLNLITTGGSSSRLDGIVELLDRKVVDPRLLRRLLVYQAAILTVDCFTDPLKSFRFHAVATASSLSQKVPLDISLVSLLIEGALLRDASLLPAASQRAVYTRRQSRGQNLDRAGVSAQHMKLLSLLTEPRNFEQLVHSSGLKQDEVRRVLYAFVLAEAAELVPASHARNVVVLEPDASSAQRLREFLEHEGSRYQTKVVKDRLALQLVLKRTRPDAMVISLAEEDSMKLCHELRLHGFEFLDQTRWIAIASPDHPSESERLRRSPPNGSWDAVLPRPCDPKQLLETLDQVLGSCGEVPRDLPERSVSAPISLAPQAAEPIRSDPYAEQPCSLDI